MTEDTARKLGRPRQALSDEDMAQAEALRDELDAALWHIAWFIKGRQEQGMNFPIRLVADILGMQPTKAAELSRPTEIWDALEENGLVDLFPFLQIIAATRHESPITALLRCQAEADDHGGKPAPVRVMRKWRRDQRGQVRRAWPGKFSIDGLTIMVIVDGEPADAPADGTACTVREVI